jgi:hypothetical protein
MFASLLWMLLLTATSAGRSAVVTKVSAPPHLTVGDRFDVSLVVTSPPGSLINGPLADSMGVFVVAGEKRKTSVRSDRAESSYRLSVAGFGAGRHRLPRFVFLVQSGAKMDTLRSDTASVTIASVLPPKMTDIHGLAPAEDFPNRLLWILPGLVALLAALAFFGRRLYRRWRSIREESAAPLPPWEEALAALDTMPWREWLETGQAKRYYYALSQVLKRYIERRFEFDAVEQTTTEILLSMRAHKTPMRDDIGKFFTRYDLVKYAKWVPPTEEAGSAIDQVREFVVKTKPQEPAAPAPAVGQTPATASGTA